MNLQLVRDTTNVGGQSAYCTQCAISQQSVWYQNTLSTRDNAQAGNRCAAAFALELPKAAPPPRPWPHLENESDLRHASKNQTRGHKVLQYTLLLYS